MAARFAGLGYRTGLIGKNHMVPTYANHGFDTLLINQITSHNAPKEYDEKAGGVRLNDYHEFLKAHGTYDYLDGYGFPNFPKEKEAEAKAYRETSAGGMAPGQQLHRMCSGCAIAPSSSSKRAGRTSALCALASPFPPPCSCPAKESRPSTIPGKIPCHGPVTDMEDMPEAVKKIGAAVSRTGRRTACRDSPEPREKARLGAIPRARVADRCDGRRRIRRSVDIEEDTLIVFTSDSGDSLGNKGTRRARVPWIPI